MKVVNIKNEFKSVNSLRRVNAYSELKDLQPLSN
jgi:hypothetical protein